MDVVFPRETDVADCGRLTCSYSRIVMAGIHEFLEQERELGSCVPGLSVAELVDGRVLEPEGATNVRPARLARATA